MTPEDLKKLCQMLRAEGVKKAMFDSSNGEPTLLEFADEAGGIPTDEERVAATVAAGGDKPEATSGFEKALDLLTTGGVRRDGSEASS